MEPTPEKSIISSASATPNAPAAQPEQKKSGKGSMIAIIALAIIAAGGIGFGGYEYHQNSIQAQEIVELKEELSVAEQSKATELVNSNSNKSQSSSTIDSATPQASNPETDSSDYIYVEEWGIKFRIPDDLEDVSYTINNYSDSDYAGTSLCVSAVLAGHDKSDNFTPNKVCLSRNSRSAPEDSGLAWQATTPVGEFYIEGPQAAMNTSQEDIDLEVASVARIREWLSDESARSEI